MPDDTSAPSHPKKALVFGRVLAFLSGIGFLTLCGLAVWFYLELRGSLPQLDGTIVVRGLIDQAVIDRDHSGIPVIRTQNRQDAAYALGYLHAQDRFFQMDGMRRYAAGEMSELVGQVALTVDRKMRPHRFRMRAQREVANLDAEKHGLLKAYTMGVNTGLASLGSNPFEYVLLQIDPVEWRLEDSLLVIYFMYLALQGRAPELESTLGVMKETLPPALFDFLTPTCTEWDVPLAGGTCEPVPIPGPELYTSDSLSALYLGQPPQRPQQWIPAAAGSNSWAVAGDHTDHGGAILANDMHLGMYVPNTWYRASLVFPGCTVTGLTLPGGPMVVAGSNTRIAWGFTNSMGDWTDLVVIEPGTSDSTYLTPEGPRPYRRDYEKIRVRFGEDEEMEIVSTIWGPLFDLDYAGRPRALRWVAYDSQAVNLGLLDLEESATVQEALHTASQLGIPAQNFVVVDSDGSIGWTLAGPIPRRFGHDGRVPRSWADGSCGWFGWYSPEESPRLINPEGGRIWTANARVVGGEGLKKIGDGGYRFSARARQIKERLFELSRPREVDMLNIQLDDHALYMALWQDLLLQVLTPENLSTGSLRGELRGYVENWGGRATPESVGYRIVRRFHDAMAEEIFDWLLAPSREADLDLNFSLLQNREACLWSLVDNRPRNFLRAGYSSWEEQCLSVVDRIALELADDGPGLAHNTWGVFNTVQSRHPFSLAFPFAGHWLDMPPEELPGDLFMPRVQTVDKGASERFVVSPGLEERGICHMPCGQSGHPFSSHYSDGHSAWVKGEPTPFLPGPAVHTLTLRPFVGPDSKREH